jgi:uncharacterized Zn finger protein
MLEGVAFPEGYRHIYAVWLLRRAREGGRCDVCGDEAVYEVDAILEGEESRLIRCGRCLARLLDCRRILLVEENYWRRVLSRELHGSRVNPKPSGEPANPAEPGSSTLLRCGVCGCFFASESDLAGHTEVCRKPGRR